MKEDNEVTYELDYIVEIDGHTIDKITFDTKHVNRGWDFICNDYNEFDRSTFSEAEVADLFEQLSQKSFDKIFETAESIKKRGYSCKRYRLLTDLIFEGESLTLYFIVDIFSSYNPQYVLVTMFEPEDE